MLRPEIDPSLRATFVPPGFQTQPVLQAMQAADVLDELHAQQQTARIHALEASLRHEVERRERTEALLKNANEIITGLQARLSPPGFLDASVVRLITVDGDDFLCGFVYANDVGEPLRLELQELWAIGAVQLTEEFDMQKLRDVLERTAEKQLRDEAQEMRDELAIDSYIFKLEGY